MSATVALLGAAQPRTDRHSTGSAETDKVDNANEHSDEQNHPFDDGSEASGFETLIRGSKTPQRLVARGLMVLAAAHGTAINAIAQRLRVSWPTVYFWPHQVVSLIVVACRTPRHFERSASALGFTGDQAFDILVAPGDATC
jgi:hypothetical protein